jgi:hypothetical protein
MTIQGRGWHPSCNGVAHKWARRDLASRPGRTALADAFCSRLDFARLPLAPSKRTRIISHILHAPYSLGSSVDCLAGDLPFDAGRFVIAGAHHRAGYATPSHALGPSFINPATTLVPESVSKPRSTFNAGKQAAMSLVDAATGRSGRHQKSQCAPSSPARHKSCAQCIAAKFPSQLHRCGHTDTLTWPSDHVQTRTRCMCARSQLLK